MITESRTHQVEPDITVFEISGRLSLGNLLQSAESAMRSLIDGGARKLVIDLTGLASIDSAGIGTLVSCSGHMGQVGGQVRLAGAQGAVAKVFQIVQIDRIIPLAADLASACGSFKTDAASA